MPTTPVFQIPYPDGPATLTPLQARFADIANGVEAALLGGLGGAPRLAHSDAERDTLVPSPVQGDSAVRPDKGYTEQYFEAYDASTNPAGAITSGWYPVSGDLPYARLQFPLTSKAWSERTLGYTGGSGGGAYVKTEDPLNWYDPASVGHITPTIPGLYRVTVNGGIPSDGGFVKVIPSNGIIFGASGGTPLGGGPLNAVGVLPFNGSTDYFSVNVYAGNATLNIQFDVFVEYIKPLRVA